jgi:transposase-like protein
VRKVRNPQTRITPELARQIVADYEAGEPIAVVAQRHGVHTTTVRDIAKRAGVASRRAVHDEAEVAEMAALYEAGASMADIGQRFGISNKTLRHLLVAAGVVVRPQGQHAPGLSLALCLTN